VKRWHDKRIKKKEFAQEIRYYFVIPGWRFLDMENFEVNGKDHSKW
jgi:hypothetical protein